MVSASFDISCSWQVQKPKFESNQSTMGDEARKFQK